jgi:hypothetical protein
MDLICHHLGLNNIAMRKNKSKVKVNPYASGVAGANGYDVNYGVTVSKGPVSLDINQNRGTGYTPETSVNMNINIPITKKTRIKGKKL